jgi:hypothetical protein
VTIHNFTFAGREWIARQVVNEANTRVLLRIEPKKKGTPISLARGVPRCKSGVRKNA